MIQKYSYTIFHSSCKPTSNSTSAKKYLLYSISYILNKYQDLARFLYVCIINISLKTCECVFNS